MRVLFINPPDELETILGVGKEFVQKYEPLGMLYIAAVTREQGHEVTVVDAYAEDLNLEEIQKRIRQIEPDVVAFSTLTCNGAMVFEIGSWIKQELTGTRVVLGNIHASVYARQYLKNRCCDVVVHGEGEYTFQKILDHFQGKIDLADIPAISYMQPDGEVVKTSDGIVVEDLSRLPLPARDMVDQRLYKLTELSNQNFVCEEGEYAKTMTSSRGCVYRCEFCVVHCGRKPRYNTPDRVVDELEILQKEYNTAYVYIMDPLFMGDRERVFAICDGIRKRGLKIKWGCDANVNFLSPEMIRAMDSANCYELALGIESGQQRLLDAVNKKIKLPRIVETVDIVRNNSDIRLEGLFILGLPGETYEDSLQTIRFAKSLDLDMAQFSILTPYPGSPLFEKMAAKREIDTGIRENDGLDPSVWKQYSSYVVFTDNEPIWVTPTLTYKQIKRLQKRALREFYLRPSQIIKQIKRLNKDNFCKSVKIAIKGFF